LLAATGRRCALVAQLARQAEQRVGRALLQFQFQLQQRQTARAVAGRGVDVAAVQGHLDLGLAMAELPPAAREIGRENGNQLASQRLQFVGQRRVIDQRHEVEGTGRRRRFPFAAPGQAADHRARRLHRQQGLAPHTALTHRDPPRQQGALGGVEVGADQPLPLRGFGRQQRMRQQRRHVLCGNRQFQFGFKGHGRWGVRGRYPVCQQAVSGASARPGGHPTTKIWT
jgi:hypothetical protein